MSVEIHPTAVVHPTAVLGEDVEIGPFAVVEAETAIGARTRLAAHAVVKRYTTLGEDNAVGEHTVLGGLPQDVKFKDEPTYLCIGSGNVFREGVTVHRATGGGKETRLGDRNFLMASSHVGHNCIVEDEVILVNGVLLAGHVLVERQAIVSGAAAVHQFARIGRMAMIGGLSAVRQDVLPFSQVVGNPARTYRLNVIGLRRRGFAAEDLAVLKRAFRILLRGGGRLEERLATLAADPSPHVAHLVEFVRGSKRGFCASAARSALPVADAADD